MSFEVHFKCLYYFQSTGKLLVTKHTLNLTQARGNAKQNSHVEKRHTNAAQTQLRISMCKASHNKVQELNCSLALHS